MKRRLSQIVLATLITAAAALLLFGPRPKVHTPPGRVRIQYWEKWAGHEADQIREIVDAFNSTVGKEKGIWVDLVSMSEIQKKTLIATAAGVPPDVAGVMDTQVGQFASKGALEPLDEWTSAKGLTRDYFKRVFYDGCTYQDRLYALPSTPWAIALLWNKQIFAEKASELRAAGLDPDRPPRSIDELDRYAMAIDTWEEGAGGSRRLKLTGYIPIEPGWWINQTVYWFGGSVVDETGTKLLLNSPETIATFDWVRSYSERLGKDAANSFKSGFGGFDSPQNAFLSSQTAMVKQGTWMYSFIEKLNPAMNRWGVPKEQLDREKAFLQIQTGMSSAQVSHILGQAARTQVDNGRQDFRWPAGVKTIIVAFQNDRVVEMRAELLPAPERQKFCQWGVAPFPSAKAGLEKVTYAGTDVLIIPSASKHKAEAFEFIAFVNRRDQTEHLNSMHCGISPLRDVSESFLATHPNPYIDVFESLVSSPNAHACPHIPTWPHLSEDLTRASQGVFLLQAPTKQILEELQQRSQQELDRARLE